MNATEAKEPNPDCGVYTITSPSGKQYVGSTKAYRQRKAVHLYQLRNGIHRSPSLLSEYQQHGEDGLVFELIEACTPDDLVRREQANLDSREKDLLHNTCLIAGSCKGMVHDAETRARISASLDGNQRALGMVHTPTAREKMSAAAKGNKRRLGIATPVEVRNLLSEKISATRNTSGFNGVSWREQYQKWDARVNVGGKRIHVGRFETPELAYAAICKFKESHHGQ